VAENLLKREFHGNNLISYVLGHSNNNKLVFETLDQALGAVPGFL
jgi:putative transposase